MNNKTSVTCILGSDADLFHIAKTVVGLAELESRGLIRLALKASTQIGPHTIVLDMSGLLIGIDLSDHSNRMQTELSGCDIYFKRCVRRECLSDRIRPFGLNYACRSTKATLRLMELFRLRDMVRRRETWKKLLCVPLVQEFERRPSEPASLSILFQARLWDPAECPGDEGVNDERIRLLLALRREFKERVVGGVVPTPYAQKHYPDRKRSVLAVWTRRSEPGILAW